ncbi:MAG: chitobiase/beta-hexosaminidase C-terminal domain-containing protein [Prevotella sp.]|nr:chitobiase/beta-hexosaminidase C-terminal domain-containing protein [Prevotella sp.]
MNRLYRMFILCLSLLALTPQVGWADDDYNPQNPGNPESPAEKYTLQLKADPANAGSFSLDPTSKVIVGSNQWISIYNNSSFKFVYWSDEKGDTVSKSSDFYYTMPKHDMTIVAHFRYDPSSPDNPPQVLAAYKLNLNTIPAGAGSFNWSNGSSVQEGDWVNLYAYNNSGYRFRELRIGDTTVVANSYYGFTMPTRDVSITAVYDYNPSSPDNPGKNYWNEQTGEVIVDDYEPGNLDNAIYYATNGNNDNVRMITVSGKVDSYDWSIANNYSNCTILDMSRTTGLDAVPSWCYNGNENLVSISLPASITKIENYALSNCASLQSIKCFALIPPSIGDNALKDLNDGLIIYVPADVVTVYQDADGWKEFTILPFTDEVKSLEVNLPDGCNPAVYKDMFLELINVRSGQKLRYVITNRVTYTFNSLIQNTTYNIYLKNRAGDILGEMNNVEIVDKNVAVTFESLKEPKTVTLAVKTPQGDDVTDQTSITWTDYKGTYLTRGNQVANQLEGNKVVYRITLPQQLALQYMLPQDSINEVAASNDLIYTLTPIAKRQIKGVVKDVKTSATLKGAQLTVTQTVHGQYSKAYSAKTDIEGKWQLDVLDMPTEVTASATDYISQTVKIDTLDNLEDNTVPTFELKDINGTTIQLSLTYTEVGGETKSYYDDYANVAYTVQDAEGNVIMDLNVQYPQIVMLDEHAEGTVFTITATSKKDRFMPVTATCTVDANDNAQITFPIKQLGGIQASFRQTDNNSIVGMLYDGNGQFVSKFDYTNTELVINELTDGTYTLVTMGSSALFNAIGMLSQFGEAGLKEGVDFLKNQVTVKSGETALIANQLVPFLDETKLYYTGSNTRFSVNKSQVTAGQYLTLRGQIDFKPVYQGRISDVKMVFELPQNCSFVDNSVMAGNAISSYTLEQNRLTVALENITDQVRFCLIPTIGGLYAPSASIEFNVDGKTMRQPIGNVVFTVSNLSITVPSVVAKTTVPVLGTAIGKSEVEIFDNGVSVGHATALANGFWNTEIELKDPINLSTHSIYAKIVTENGLELQSDVQELLYDQNAIEPTKVTMINVAHPASTLDLCEYVTEFDFTNPGKKAKPYWYWPSYPDFTFLIDFTNNDTTMVTNVLLHVLLSNNTVSTLTPVFDGKRKCWVATAKYNSDALPTNVMVDYASAAERYFDKRQLEEATAEMEGYLKEYQDIVTDIAETFDGVTITEATTDEEIAALDDKCEKINALFGDDIDAPLNTDSLDAVLNAMSDEEFATFMNQELEALQAEDATTAAYLNDMSQWLAFNEHGEFTLPNGTKFTMADCTGLTPEGLKEAGYMEMQCVDGSAIYVLMGEQTTEYVDFVKGVRVTIQMAVSAGARTNRSIGDVAEKVANAVAAINDFIKDVNKWTLGLNAKILASEKNLEYAVLSLQMRMNRANYFINYAKTHGRWYERLSWLGEKVMLKKNLLQAKAAQWLSKKIFRYALKALPVVKYVSFAISLANDIKDIGTLYYSIPDPCPQDESNASFWRKSTYALLIAVIAKATVELVNEFTSDAEIVGGVVGSVATAGVSLTASAWGIAQKVLVGLGSFAVDAGLSFAKNKIKKGIKKLECYKNEEEKKKKDEIDWPFNPVEHVMDPSGFVYEAVSSNRVQGVTASCYYKEVVEDMYGDLHENIVLWNAEEYAQENPLFTDENGMYQWDVPQGLWRVKFEKEGYQTTYSEWLPVPPPQLDVNIAMTQMVQPVVKSGKAYSEGVEIEFDKYMDPATLTTDNIKLTRNGVAVEGSIKLLNEEQVSKDNAQTYASKVLFQMPAEQELLTTDEVKLTIAKSVESYAGVPMEEDYSQSFDVLPRVRNMAVDSLVNVGYGTTRIRTIAALPADASKGKVVRVKALSNTIAKVNAETLTLDENGEAEVEVSGELPGQTVISFKVEDTEIQGQMIVNVKDANELFTLAPRASRVSGTEVYRGTQIRLTSETENAEIYYTLDGSCPCDDNNPAIIKYDAEHPIVIADDNVTIKAQAKGVDLEASETAEFTFKLKKTTMGYNFNEGWTWVSHNFEQPVAVKEFAPTAELIVSQTEEAINDPVYGLMGTLKELQPAQAYKVKVLATKENVLTGYEYNALSKSIDVTNGWNWIGYPISQTMTLDEAFAFFTPMEGDYVLGQDGFAEYVDGKWTGGLEGLKPGKGYLFKSGKADEIIFNTTIVSVAASRIDKHISLNDAPWACDKYAYANLMPMTAQLYQDGAPVKADEFVVGAFAGTECRGIGIWKDDKVLMNIVGDNKEDITFIAANLTDGRFFDITESVQFHVDNVGSWCLPYALHIGKEATGIKELYDELEVTPVFSDHITVSAGGRTISKMSLTNMSGRVVLIADNLGTGAVIPTGTLSEGVYVATVVADGQTYYKKILKVNK